MIMKGDYVNKELSEPQEYVSALIQREARSVQRMTEMDAELSDKNGVMLAAAPEGGNDSGT